MRLRPREVELDDEPCTSTATSVERRVPLRRELVRDSIDDGDSTTPEPEETDDDEPIAGDESNGEKEEESSSEEEVELPEPLAPNRSRRSNAGNRMAQMLTEKEKQEGDEVYETLYGGFDEVENDVNFELNDRDMKDGHDEEDKNSELDEQSAEGEDFETDDEDDENGAADGNDDGSSRRRKKKKRGKSSWLLSKLSSTNVPENALSESEQRRRLKECKSIAKENRESLAAMKARQLVEQKKNTMKARPRYIEGPKESWHSTSERTYLLIPELKKWKRPSIPKKLVCAVSGKEARYVDPLTKLPYKGIEEFKQLRANHLSSTRPFVQSQKKDSMTTKQSNLILFDQSKKQQFHLRSGFRNLQKHLRNQWNIEVNNDELTDVTFEKCQIFVVPCPRAKFYEQELLDAVIRTVFYKYFDPKEALITNGVLNRSIAVAAGKSATKSVDDNKNDQALSFVYPYGATLSVNRNAIPVLSTGSVCFPISRPICAFHTTEQDIVLKFLSDGLELNQIDASAPELVDPHPIPDHVQMSSKLKMCIQESEVEQNLPVDFTKLFDNSIKSLDLSICYEKLDLKHETLTLVVPAFEVPQPGLQPAVFPPCFRELPPPQLELFDLDDAFSSTETQLAQLANKSTERDVDRFIRDAADLLDVTKSLPADRRGAKDILEHVLMQLVEFKKSQYGLYRSTRGLRSR
ncbi:Intraflagellar transport protein 52-like protein [Aphelenchoides besseyi]|nr:Intraflagellar transport protein 52-like protein [Aphelenchoides besseyi]